MIFFLASHIVSCFWLIIAELVITPCAPDTLFQPATATTPAVAATCTEKYNGTWLSNFSEYFSENISLYYVSFYWTITTITTVGYGDISGTNNYERMFASFVMVVGVILFSIANGALASIISSLDGQSGEYEDKLNTLILAHKEF